MPKGYRGMERVAAGGFFPMDSGNQDNDLRRLIRDVRAMELERAQNKARSGLFASLPDPNNPFENYGIEELPPRSTAQYGDDPFAPQPEDAAQRYIDTLPADDPIFRRRRPELDQY